MAEPDERARCELRGLRLSVVGAFGMAALGAAFFFPTGSLAVLLDGAFSLIGAAVGIVAMRVATLVRRPDDDRFHFGYAAYEPMLNLSKGILILVVSLFAAVASIGAILQGGRPVQGSTAAIYAVVAATGCLVIALVQRRIGRRTGSPLLEVDSRNWLIDGMMSGAVAVAFVAVVFVERTEWSWVVPYADPVLVLVLVLLSAPIPFGIIRNNWTQLLGRAPGDAVQREAHDRVARALDGVTDVVPHLRLLETGRTCYLQVYLVVGPESGLDRLEDLDRLRDRLHESVCRAEPEIGLDVIFTRDEKWIRHAVPFGVTRSEDGGPARR